MAAGGHHGSNRDHYHRQYDQHVLRPQGEDRGLPQELSAPGWSDTRIAAGLGGSDGAGAAFWHPRSYSCSFCRREFRSAQALGGHMNVHRRDRARLRETSPPTTSSSSTNSSSATHTTIPDHQAEHHSPATTVNPAATLPPLQSLSTGPFNNPHVSPPGLDSSKPMCSPSSVASLPASSRPSKPVLQPKRFRNYDYGAAPINSAAAYSSSSSSARPTTCLQLMSSPPAVIMGTVLQSTPKISSFAGHVSSLRPGFQRDHHRHRDRNLEADAPGECLQLPPTIVSCSLHSSSPEELKCEISRKSSMSTGFQPYQQLQPRPEYNKLSLHKTAQNVNAVDTSLILSPVGGLDLDLELRLGHKL